MLSLGDAGYLVYNSGKEIIIMNVNQEVHEYTFEFFKNQENLSNEEIQANLNKQLKFMDRLELLYKNSKLNTEPKNNDKIFAGKIWRENFLDVDNKQHIEIIDTIRFSLNQGKTKDVDSLARYWKINCPLVEASTICTKLSLLGLKHAEENKEKESQPYV